MPQPLLSDNAFSKSLARDENNKLIGQKPMSSLLQREESKRRINDSCGESIKNAQKLLNREGLSQTTPQALIAKQQNSSEERSALDLASMVERLKSLNHVVGAGLKLPRLNFYNLKCNHKRQVQNLNSLIASNNIKLEEQAKKRDSIELQVLAMFQNKQMKSLEDRFEQLVINKDV